MNKRHSHSSLRHTAISQLVVRQALPEDVMDIFRWRNDQHACAMSRHIEPISEADHRNWYSRVINDTGRLLIIGLLLEQKAGIVRFDRLEDSLWEVSITLDAEARGRGMGRRLLEMALEFLQKAYAPTKVLAVARLSNEASIRLFLSLGFKQVSDDGELVSLILPINAADSA